MIHHNSQPFKIVLSNLSAQSHIIILWVKFKISHYYCTIHHISNMQYSLLVYHFWQLNIRHYSHLKNRMAIPVHITIRAIITRIGVITLSTAKPSEAAFKSFIPWVNGSILEHF